MAREYTADQATTGSKNQPTHKVVIETAFGNLTVSLFTKNNAFHAQLAEAFTGEDIANFIKNKMSSAVVTKITDVVEINDNTLEMFKDANKAA
jgi:hypothetical protein